MPTFYNFTENGVVYNFDDVFVPSDLFRDGNLWTWGPGNNGELGNNNTTTRSTPVTTSAGGANWKQVSMGTFHTAAIKTDGTLWTWGYGGNGQLGNAAITNRSTPVTTFAGGTNWKQVSGGDQHTAAIKTDGTLWTWGYCSNGRLGNAVITTGRSTPVTTFAGGTNWKQVSLCGASVAAIKTDGTLWTWGSGGILGDNTTTNKSTPVTTFAGGTNWKQVSCGYTFMQAIKTDGTLWVWGSNAFGQLGNNNSSGVLTPVTTFAGGTNWKSSNGGYGHTIAIKTDGTLWTWGRNNLGQLGNNSTTNCSTPVTTFAGGNNWKSTGSIRGFFFPVLPSTDGNISAAIKTDGTLWTWGQGSYGSLGNNTTTTRSTPVTTFAGGTNWKQVSCGSMNMAALTYDDPVI
jgi:alpha-tubulin suppressor-like RCC1 family protein